MQKHYLAIEKLKKRSDARKKLNKDVVATPESTSSHLVKVAAVAPAPLVTSLKDKCPTPYDQGEIGSCTANAFCAAYCIMDKVKNGMFTFKPSRLFLYFYERLMEDPQHNVKNLTDSGADVVDGESFVKSHGICSEATWPYNTDKYNIQPPASCMVNAKTHKISSFHTIANDANLINNIKKSINNKTPVLIAIQVFESFGSAATAKTGMVPLPKNNEQSLGGHEMCLIGYTDSSKLFTVLNSWGPGWGNGGYCYIPYDYLTNPNLGMEFTVFSL